MAFANTMASRLAAARQAMTSDKAYRGSGVSTPRRAPILGGNQGKGGQGNFRRVSRQPGVTEANIRPRGGGIFDAIRSQGKKFVHPALEMLGRAGDTVKGAMMGSRLHKSYMDELGRSKGHEAWKDAKMKMMTDDERAGYEKYLNLASMAQDSTERDKHLATAEQHWRNKQTSDRLAAVMGFEDYDKSVDADKYFVEKTDYRGNPIPGRGRLNQVLQQFAPQEEGEIRSPHLDPDMDITADLGTGQSMLAQDLNPRTPPFRPQIKEKPSFPFFPEDYEYPDEGQLSPYSPPVDPYEGIYESPLTDMTYGEELIDATPERPLHSRHEFRPRDTVGITRMGGGMNAFKNYVPRISVAFGNNDDFITPNITDINYFNQFMGRDSANPGGMANPTDEDEQINPAWNKALGKRGYGG